MTAALAVAEVESGGIVNVQLQAVDPLGALWRVLPKVENRKAGRNVIVEPVVTGPVPLIRTDATALERIYFHLLDNAVKFNNNPIPVIHISCERILVSNKAEPQLPASNYYKLSISDNGIGFDAQYSEKIFTIFQRLHTVQEYEGTGIGLAICKKIIEKHNGEFAATSEINQGTTFTIILPVRQG